MPNATEPSGLPLSPALAEASPDSLTELFSRDPEGYQAQDLDRVIEALRAQRARWAAAEAQGASRAPKAKSPGAAQALKRIAGTSAAELDL